MKYAFAGDRAISVNILRFLILRGFAPSALLVSETTEASHASDLIGLAQIDNKYVFKGNAFKKSESLKKLEELNLDYIIGIHFPYIIPKSVLEIPKIGVLNLHPAYLPYNKGWHTPSWAIIEGKPYGATLHFMEEALDKGNIIHQKKLQVLPEDTADSLYQKALKLEEEVFFESFDKLVSLNPKSEIQSENGTSHLRKDLKSIQKIELNKTYTGEEILNKLRALTTNSISEAAYFEIDDKRIAVQVILKNLEDNGEAKN